MTTITGSDGLTYTYDTTTYTLTVTGSGQMKAVSYGNIDSGALDASAVAHLIIGAGITLVQYNSFLNCTSLQDISFPTGLTRVGAYAFYNTPSVTELILPSTLDIMDSAAFQGCGANKIVFKGSQLSSMGGGCLNLNPSSVTVYSTGWATSSTITSSIAGSNVSNWTFIGSLPTDYKKLTYNGFKLQVDSAVRDGNGKKIDTNYQQKLVSGTNIKTVNSASLLGSGDLSVQPTLGATTITIATTDWSANACTKSVTGVTTTSKVWVSPDDGYESIYANAGVKAKTLGSGTITFNCTTTPSSAIDVNVVIG